VQNYLRDYGARKVEANALVIRPEAGRRLCLDAITKYIDADAPQEYFEMCQKAQRQINQTVRERTGHWLDWRFPS
jgi:hypothetical protein